jgi:hypothetical protein
MRVLLLIVGLALNTFAASPLIFGARGGVPLTDNTNNLTNSIGLTSPGGRYEIGPTVGVRLPLGFSVEGDALFNRETLNIGQFAGFSALNTHADSWEFPVMLKFTPGHSAIAPVLGAGFSVRHINNLGSIPSYVLAGTTNSNSVGFVAGGGVRFKAGPVSITPEIRYTRWNSNSLAQSLLDVISSNRNQAEVLVGLTF